MIRLTFMLRRKPEMSRAEFQKYRRTSNSPLSASGRRARGGNAPGHDRRRTGPPLEAGTPMTYDGMTLEPLTE